MNRILATLTALMLAACAPAATEMAKQEERSRAREGGIGGTGIQLAEGGVGGTGAPWAGARGTVTGFGSIHVNGLRVTFPPDGALDPSGARVREAEIALGETVEVVGRQTGPDTVEAAYAFVPRAVVGPVDRVFRGGRQLSVLGADIRVEPGAPVVDAATGAPVTLAKGDRVAVSALPAGDRLIASRIERLGAGASGVAYGVVRNGTIHNIGILGVEGLPEGVPVRVTGRVVGDSIAAQSVERGLLASLASPLDELSVEGFLVGNPRAPTGYVIDGFGTPMDAASRVRALRGDRAIFIGALDPEAFRVRHGLTLPDDAPARVRLLEGLEGGFAPAGAVETR